MNYKKMSFISGLVIFTSAMLVLISIIVLAEKRIFFTRDYIIYVDFQDITGLQDQAKVYMRGYRVGWTKEVEFNDDAIRVRVDINKKFSIPADSRFELNTVSILGDKAITINPGSSSEFLEQGDMVIGENMDIMNKISSTLDMVRGDLEKGEIQARIQKMAESVDYIHSILGKLDKQVEYLNFNEYNRQIANVGQAGMEIQKLVKENSDSLSKSIIQFNKTLADLSLLSKETNLIAQKINSGEGTVGQLVNSKDYINKMDKTVTDLQQLIADFKENPKKYIDLTVF